MPYLSEVRCPKAVIPAKAKRSDAALWRLSEALNLYGVIPEEVGANSSDVTHRRPPKRSRSPASRSGESRSHFWGFSCCFCSCRSRVR